MNRTFAFLCMSLGLLAMSGCGDVKGSNSAAARAQTAVLQPIAPAPEDRDLKLAPPPLAPAPLPKIDTASVSINGGERLPGESANQQPALAAGGATPGPTTPVAPPAVSPVAPTVVSPVAPPVNPAAAPPAVLSSNGPSTTVAPPVAGEARVALSNVSIGRIDRNHISFKLDYAFISGQPDPATEYRVLITCSEVTSPGSIIRLEKNLRGSDLRPNGKLMGVVDYAGRSPTFHVTFIEFKPPQTEREISEMAEVNVHRDLDKDDRKNLQPAAVGVGAQGKGYGGGLVTTPVSAYFAAKQMIVFNIQLPEAMELFKASNNRYPNSQAEFDEKIIKEEGIHLPELPAGERYVYDPASGQLMVEHPDKK